MSLKEQGWVNTGKNQPNEQFRYHTDPTCQYVSAESLRIERANVDADELEPCEFCSGDLTRAEQQGRPCPFCGDMPTQHLPNHLPHCDEAP